MPPRVVPQARHPVSKNRSVYRREAFFDFSSGIRSFIPTSSKASAFFFGIFRPDVLIHYILPLALRFENVFDGISQCAIASAVASDVVRFLLDFVASVRDGDGESAIAHGRQINHVVSDKSGFACKNACLFNNFFKSRELVLNALVDIFEVQIPRAEGDGLGYALGNQSGLDARQVCQRNSRTIVRVKTFHFDEALAPWLALRAFGGRNNKKLAIGEDTIHVEQQEFDFASTLF